MDFVMEPTSGKDLGQRADHWKAEFYHAQAGTRI
jgi:hypothetical protein